MKVIKTFLCELTLYSTIFQPYGEAHGALQRHIQIHRCTSIECHMGWWKLCSLQLLPACSIQLQNCNLGSKCSYLHHISSHRIYQISFFLFVFAVHGVACIMPLWTNLMSSQAVRNKSVHQYNTFKTFNL